MPEKIFRICSQEMSSSQRHLLTFFGQKHLIFPKHPKLITQYISHAVRRDCSAHRHSRVLRLGVLSTLIWMRFYASVEQRDQPALRGQPLAVARVERRGVVVAASYEARAYGVRSAMPSIVARRKCSQLVFVPPRFPVYHVVSAQIHEIFRRYTAIIQPLSLDEAYLDVTEAASKYGSATAIAEAIREDIRRETGLAASAGVSYNRFFGKTRIRLSQAGWFVCHHSRPGAGLRRPSSYISISWHRPGDGAAHGNPRDPHGEPLAPGFPRHVACLFRQGREFLL